MATKLDDLDLPRAVAGLVRNLANVDTSGALSGSFDSGARWQPSNSDLPDDDTERWLFRATGLSTELADRAADLRALVTAYSQAVATNRPELTQLARWQRISPSALRHRYNDAHVQAVHELVTEDPLIDIVLEPFIAVVDSDFAGISSAMDEQLVIRSRMRAAAAAEFLDSFGADAGQRLGFPQNPAGERITRPIADFGIFMTRALRTREPELLPVFEEWQKRFNARKVKPSPEDRKATRVRTPRASR